MRLHARDLFVFNCRKLLFWVSAIFFAIPATSLCTWCFAFNRAEGRCFFVKMSETPTSVELLPPLQKEAKRQGGWGNAAFGQVVRFGMVGILNTLIDILTLNFLLWLFPTHNANLLLIYNSLAYTLGAVNSFSLNKYWTFKHKRSTTGGEVVRFAIINVIGIACNDITIWIVARTLHSLISSNILWANTSKLSAIAVTLFVSFFGMRLWVFANAPRERQKNISEGVNTSGPIRAAHNRRGR